jgi:small subunit ribosomal protein S20
VDVLPNIKSAKKRVLVNEKKALENQKTKNNLRTTIKGCLSAMQGGDKEAIEASLKTTVKKIDQAVAKGILHKNTAARKKSQLAAKANKVTA